MKKSNLKILEEIKSIGLVDKQNPDITVLEFCFLLKRIILEQQKQILELDYKIALMNGEVEDE